MSNSGFRAALLESFQAPTSDGCTGKSVYAIEGLCGLFRRLPRTAAMPEGVVHASYEDVIAPFRRAKEIERELILAGIVQVEPALKNGTDHVPDLPLTFAEKGQVRWPEPKYELEAMVKAGIAGKEASAEFTAAADIEAETPVTAGPDQASAPPAEAVEL